MDIQMQTPSDLGVAETMAQAIDDLVNRVTAAAKQYSDPVDQADSLELALAQVAELQQRIGQARSAAVAEALKSRTASDVADQMGLSRQRVYQLVRGIDAHML